MKRLVIYSSIIALLLIAWTAAHNFSAELSAAAWHIQHGSHVEINGIRVDVPLPYEVSESPGLPTLLMMKQAGRLWHGGGFIDIDFHKQPSPEATRLMESMGILKKTVGERMTTFAGKPGKCIEAIPQTGDARLQELMRERDFIEIECWFDGEVEVTFRGTANLRDEFYSIVRAATPVQRKR